ncbi:hypothetical protein ACFSB1_00985 [Halopseudomonas phragmitis]|uniref:Uncharacterized protein n=1 Tax=Halopseudomonas phragmitis TaxID=1931241 RepID=A0A1V0B6I1_9GAMM|nr:hypothetical protein [Halopseudomonas phragmitis]AQZ95552.1 hypothetical protein BVH74_12680 [Halopseudomonas phragmitis]PAU86322.1 hypothetical protein CK507_15885 [Pseudomonas sp. WN033]
MSKLLAVIGLLWVGWFIGWVHAHITVATECRQLGAFFVGKTVFRCTAIESQDQEQASNE